MRNDPYQSGNQPPGGPYQSDNQPSSGPYQTASRPYPPGNQPPSGPYQPGNPYTPSSPGYPTTDPYPTSAPTYVSQNSYAPPPPPMYQPTYSSLVPPPLPEPRGSRNRMLLIISIVVIVLLIAGTAGVFALHAANNGTTVSTPTPTATPVPYPHVASAYSGSVHNTSFNQDAYMIMTSVTQDSGTINGNIQFGLPLIGSGAFTGTVTRSNAVNFTVTSSDNGGVTLIFSGIVDTQGFMSGNYTVNNGQKGMWRATPSTNPVLYPLLFHNYKGSFTNNSTHKTDNFTLQIITQNQQNFTGTFDNSLSFDGTVGSDNSIQFTVTDAQGTSIKFTGTVNVDGSLSGPYTANSGVTGTWRETPA